MPRLFQALVAFPIWSLVPLAALALGCRDPRASHANRAADHAILSVSSEVERGPVRWRVDVAPQPARLSDELTMTLSAEHEPGVDLEWPPFGESLGEFLIRDFRQPLSKLHDGRQLSQQIYALEPTRSGELPIHPLVITYVDRRPQGDGKRHEMSSEALIVEIRSAVASELPSLNNLHPAAPPIPIPSGIGWIPWMIAGGVLTSALVGWIAWRRHRRHWLKSIVLTPREEAERALHELLQRDLAATDVKLFYVDLTGIVRRYIEDTTGVRAPEQTTEEFLREIGTRELFNLDQRGKLKDFLEAADLVKYAAFRPHSGDIEVMLERAKDFLKLRTIEPLHPVEIGR